MSKDALSCPYCGGSGHKDDIPPHKQDRIASLAQGVGVKPLEWTTPHQHCNTAYAETILGTWTVWDFGGEDSHVRGPKDHAGWRVGGGIEAAKAFAQSEFSDAIRSALVAGAVEAEPESAAMPKYGEIDFAELGRDVSEATMGQRHDFNFGKFYPGHVMVPAINFNSLSRIVSKYASPPREELERVKRERDEARKRSGEHWRRLRRLWNRASGYDPDDNEEGPRCRDCADENGRCPHTGYPCDPQEEAEERIVKLFDRAEAAEFALAEARAQLAALSREGGR